VIKSLIFLAIMVFFFVGCSLQPQREAIIVPDTKTTHTVAVDKNTTETSILESGNEQNVVSYQEEKKTILQKDHIAIIYPSSEINRYALEATKTINGYLLEAHKDSPYHIESADIMTQSPKNIKNAIIAIADKGIKKIILMITKQYFNVLKDSDITSLGDVTIVLPLINKSEVNMDSSLEKLDILFTGISYEDQFKKLVEYSNNAPLVDFYDNSSIGTTLHQFASQHQIKYSRKINDNNGYYKKIVKSLTNRLNDSALILNTPIVKSSMLLSALTAEEVYPSVILSTQLNFTPLVFSLTQRFDRDNLVVASSIGEFPENIEGYSELLGNNILYNWVNYSSMIAVEYLRTGNINIFKDLKIVKKQVIYPVKLYKVRKNSFLLLPF